MAAERPSERLDHGRWLPADLEAGATAYFASGEEIEAEGAYPAVERIEPEKKSLPVKGLCEGGMEKKAVMVEVPVGSLKTAYLTRASDTIGPSTGPCLDAIGVVARMGKMAEAVLFFVVKRLRGGSAG